MAVKFVYTFGLLTFIQRPECKKTRAFPSPFTFKSINYCQLKPTRLLQRKYSMIGWFVNKFKSAKTLIDHLCDVFVYTRRMKWYLFLRRIQPSKLLALMSWFIIYFFTFLLFATKNSPLTNTSEPWMNKIAFLHAVLWGYYIWVYTLQAFF